MSEVKRDMRGERDMRGRGQRETLGVQEVSGLTRPSCLSGQESSLVSQLSHVPRDTRGESGGSHKMEGVTTNELCMLDRRMERLRLGGLI